MFERDDLGDTHERTTALAIAPVFGATDRIELAIPIEFADTSALDTTPATRLSKFGLELRRRFGPRKATWTPLLRAAAIRDTIIRTELRLEAELGVAVRYGKLHAEVSGGVVSELNLGGVHDELRLGAGASVEVKKRVRLGGELHAEVALDKASTSWATVGPTLAWTHKRLYFTGHLGIGVRHIAAAPRINWGVIW
jgi:hypothetical protein